jgi:DNA polymerase-3 subunit gamma/tau
MEKFIVSARKYRPQNFNTVVGQPHITTTLKNAINNNQLAHAFLFCGPRGVGKTTCARILAKTINCENRTPDGEACNSCNSCVSFDSGTSLNIHELDAASNNSVDDIRTLVEQVRFAPQAGKYKVYIVDEVHMLSASAFNAFLKTLEEPPHYAIFILATTEKHKILPTILSRCQIFDFKRITINDTIEHLEEICAKEDITSEKAALHVIAQKSEGCMRDALSILDKIVSFTGGKINYSNTLEHLNILDEDYYFRLLDLMFHQKLSDALLLFDSINQKGFEGDTLLEGFAEFMRNLLVSKDARAAILLEVADDFKQRYLEAAEKISASWLVAAMNIINESAGTYKLARNKRLHVEMTIIKLTYLQQAVEILSKEGSVRKKKLVEDAKPVSFRALSVIKIPEPAGKVAAPAPIKAKEEARMIVEEPKAIPITAVKSVPEPAVSSNGTVTSLSKIRAQVSEKLSAFTNAPRPLTSDALIEAWAEFIKILATNKNHSAASNFKTATLEITGENSFDIITGSQIQKTFIETERPKLIHHLQTYFNNRLLKYSLVVKESADAETQSQPRSTVNNNSS